MNLSRSQFPIISSRRSHEGAPVGAGGARETGLETLAARLELPALPPMLKTAETGLEPSVRDETPSTASSHETISSFPAQLSFSSAMHSRW